MSKKMLIVPMPLAMHTKLKWQAKQDGQSMSQVVRGLVDEYLRGERHPLALTPNGTVVREEHPDFYDDLLARVQEAVRD